MINRAKQFMPFDALKGFKEAIKEKERIIVPFNEPTEEDIIRINDTLTKLKKGMMVKITYYDKDSYVLIEGLVSKIDPIKNSITVVKKEVLFKYIKDISCSEI